MINPPNYMERANIRDPLIRYSWDDWKDIEEVVGSIDDKVVEDIQCLSNRAKLALIIAAAEWIAYRLDKLADDALPFHAIESCWAQIIDKQYGVQWDPFDREEWVGPILGPIRFAMVLMIDNADLLWHGKDITYEAAIELKLAEHIVTNTKSFLNWRNEVIARLKKLYPYKKDDPLGDSVPREVFDIDVRFVASETNYLVNKYLSQLDPDDNDFLNSSKSMKDAGFEGTPYLFDIKIDRKFRRQSMGINGDNLD